MRTFVPFLSLCAFCACNTMYVAANKNTGNTTTICVEWNCGDFPNEILQQKVDTAVRGVLNRFNAQKHAFSVHPKSRVTKTRIT